MADHGDRTMADALLNEFYRRNRRLTALKHVGLMLGQALDPETLLRCALQLTVEALDLDAGGIWLTTPGDADLQLHAARGLPEALQRELAAVPADGNWLGEVVAGGLPRFADLDTPVAVGADPLADLGFAVRAYVPLRQADQVWGVLVGAARAPASLDSDDRETLEAIGCQLAHARAKAPPAAMAEARAGATATAMQAVARRAELLADIGALFVSSRRAAETLQQAAGRTAAALGGWSAIVLRDEAGSGFVTAALAGEGLPAGTGPAGPPAARPDTWGDLGRLGLGPLPIEPGLLESVLAKGEPRLVDEPGAGPVSAPGPLLLVPMTVRGHGLGVLAIAPGRRIHEADASLAVEIARRAAAATESGRVFEASRIEQEQLRATLEQAPDGVILVDRDLYIARVNPAAMRVLELEATPERWTLDARLVALGLHDAEGRRPLPDDLPLTRAVRDGEVVVDERWYLGDPGERERAISLSASPLRNDGGEIFGGVALVRDVTAEQELDRMKDEFLAVISHELRTPLTAILGYTDILLAGIRGPLTPAQADVQRAVRENARRLLNLINDLLEVSRLKARGMGLTTQTGSLRHAADMAIRSQSDVIRRRRIVVANAVPADLPPTSADEEKLQQVLRNLLSNAVKFTEPEGHVAIEARPTDNPTTGQPEVVVTVRDTGIGIPPELQARIWDRFQQADSSARRRFSGAGIGLAIVRGLVDLHGGRVWVESEGVPGKGSAFSFTLPVGQPASVGTGPEPVARLPHSRAHERGVLPAAASGGAALRPLASAGDGAAGGADGRLVLIVDDDADLIRIIQTYLEEAGYETLVAMSGRQALQLARQRRPFAITLDIRLPDIDGWTVLRRLKQDPATESIPVIVISMLEGREVGHAMGAVEFLGKPLDRGRLVATLRRLTQGDHPRILVVDDDPHIAEILRAALEAAEMEVVAAQDGGEALPLVQAGGVDVIVLDLMMPGMDGFELLRRLRENEVGRAIPVVILTAKELTADERARLSQNAQRVVLKSGLRLESLLADIDACLRTARQGEQADLSEV